VNFQKSKNIRRKKMKLIFCILILPIIAVVFLNCGENLPIGPAVTPFNIITDIPFYEPDTSSGQATVIPTQFIIDGIFWEDSSKTNILVVYSLPRSCRLQLSIIEPVTSGSVMTGTAMEGDATDLSGIHSFTTGDVSAQTFVICKLVDKNLTAGRHNICWNKKIENGEEVTAGVYGVYMIAEGEEFFLFFKL
jgi:hypothetical protein